MTEAQVLTILGNPITRYHTSHSEEEVWRYDYPEQHTTSVGVLSLVSYRVDHNATYAYGILFRNGTVQKIYPEYSMPESPTGSSR
jgi:hypothetical protein